MVVEKKYIPESIVTKRAYQLWREKHGNVAPYTKPEALQDWLDILKQLTDGVSYVTHRR
jgi:hypothetical protein